MIFNVTLPSDGTNADVRDYNDPLTQILAGLNGQLNDDNISGLSGAKITAGTLPESALADALKTGWFTQSQLPTSIVPLGQRSYTVTYASSVAAFKSPGTKNRFVRQTAVPIQSASLNGSNQYFVKTSPNKMTWTDDFVVSAWVKMSSYQDSIVVSRYNGTSGWRLRVLSDGTVMLRGYNASSANFSGIQSYQSIPLNKWIHIAVQLDMSSFSATSTTSYVMINGVSVPAVVARAGTNPTALVQAGNLEIGSDNGGTTNFAGKIAQVAIYNAKVTQATILASMNQGLTGAETNLASGYTLSNSVADLNTTTPNDLTAQNSATTTNADSPFGNSGVSTTIEYGITMAISSDGLTETIQVAEGCMLPSTGNINAISYSQHKAPFNFPISKDKWKIESLYNAQYTSSVSSGTAYNQASAVIYVPTGSYNISFAGPCYVSKTSSTSTGQVLGLMSLSAASATMLSNKLTSELYVSQPTSGTVEVIGLMRAEDTYEATTLTPIYVNLWTELSLTALGWYSNGTVKNGSLTITAENGYL